MSKHLTTITVIIIIAVAGISFYLQYNNKLSLTKLTGELNNIQVQVNRGITRETTELNEEQKQALEAAYKKIWDARRNLIEVEQQIGLITKNEADYLLDHLDLMIKYGHNYEPPTWESSGHMGRGWHGMGHHR